VVPPPLEELSFGGAGNEPGDSMTVPFSSVIIGGHDSPFKMGHVFTNPKKGNKESPGKVEALIVSSIFCPS